MPERVVAPMRVNRARLRRMLRALGPWSMTMSRRKSSIAGYRYSSMAGWRRWISSMKRIEPRERLVRMPARSPAFSIMGPLVVLTSTPMALPRMKARVVLPSPGGPERRMCWRTSPRALAASTMSWRRSTVFRCPRKSWKRGGRREASNASSAWASAAEVSKNLFAISD